MHTTTTTGRRRLPRPLTVLCFSSSLGLRQYVLQERHVHRVWLPVDVRAATGHRRIHLSTKGQPVRGSDTKQRRAPRDEIELMVVDIIRQRVDEPWDWVEHIRNSLIVRAQVSEHIPEGIQGELDVVTKGFLEVVGQMDKVGKVANYIDRARQHVCELGVGLRKIQQYLFRWSSICF